VIAASMLCVIISKMPLAQNINPDIKSQWKASWISVPNEPAPITAFIISAKALTCPQNRPNL
jgi:hypothetical protein